MKWLTPKETKPALSLAAQTKEAFFQGNKFAGEGLYWSIPGLAFEAATAQKGEMLPTLAVQVASIGVQIPATGVVSAMLAASIGFPPGAAAFAATALVGIAANQFEHTLIRSIKTTSDAAQNMTRARFGSGYLDTQTAQQRRQRAAMEITGALPTGRRWAGQEATFLHK